MKLAAKSLLLLLTTAATFAYAQSGPNTPIKHVIVVIQEKPYPGQSVSGYKSGQRWW
jgi:hypothetical protein